MASSWASLQSGGLTVLPWPCQPSRCTSRATCASSLRRAARSHSWSQRWRCTCLLYTSPSPRD
eukprot:6663670-Alexandrium_andersonii.AAC.1